MTRVMVVEDEPVVRRLLVDLLSDEGYDILEAATADDAVMLLQMGERVRVLITDIYTGGRLDGIALAKAVREIAPSIPIAFISGLPWKLTEALDIGGPLVLIPKPFTSDRFLADVRRLAA